jgi:hypothetical protein
MNSFGMAVAVILLLVGVGLPVGIVMGWWSEVVAYAGSGVAITALIVLLAKHFLHE